MSRKNSGGRTLAVTVNDLLDSVRFKLAMKSAQNGDYSFIKAILIELGMECESVAKNTVIRAWHNNKAMGSTNLMLFLKTVGNADSDYQFSRYNKFWSLSPLEQQLYTQDPKMKKSPEEYQEMLDKLRIRMMGS